MILDRDLWDRMQRVARRVAADGRFGRYAAPVPLADRYDAALDAITWYVAGNGWPGDGDIRPVLQAVGRAMHKIERDAPMHLRYRAYWMGPETPDELAEQVTDEVGVHQVLAGLTVMERAVVRALADAYQAGGGPAEAAAALGMRQATFNHRLYSARRRAAALWVAPGDTPFRRYVIAHGNKRAKAWNHRRNQTYWRRRALREEPA